MAREMATVGFGLSALALDSLLLQLKELRVRPRPFNCVTVAQINFKCRHSFLQKLNERMPIASNML